VQENRTKPYNLEERTLVFTKEVIRLCQKVPKDTINRNLVDQLIRASGSIGANYREANENLSKKDLLHRIKIARKEAKETTYWLELLKETNDRWGQEIDVLISETKELRNILSKIISNLSEG